MKTQEVLMHDSHLYEIKAFALYNENVANWMPSCCSNFKGLPTFLIQINPEFVDHKTFYQERDVNALQQTITVNDSIINRSAASTFSSIRFVLWIYIYD